MKYFLIYKITNLINEKYYIGRHATKNLNDGYLGSGKGIKNAITKYGKENFKKEILVFANSAEELWKLEEEIVNKEVLKDPKSYNQSLGGKNWMISLANSDVAIFKKHQSKAGKKGADASKNMRTKEWHQKGGAKSREKINSEYKYEINTPTGDCLYLDGNTLRKFCLENDLSYDTMFKNSKIGKIIKKGKCANYIIKQISNPNHHSTKSKNHQKESSKKRKKYTCEICNRENLDAGNLKLHLFRKHNYSQENYQSYINKII